MYKIKSSKKNDVSPEHGNESAESQPVQKKVSKKSTFLKPNQLNIFHDFTDKKSSDIQFMKAKTKSDYNKCRRELSEQLNITDKTHKTHGNNYDPSQKSWTPERILKDLVAPIPNEEKQEELLEHGKHVIQAKRNDTGLPNKLKSGVENLSGISLDDVKVHYNSSRPAQLHALAYTQGTDIHVAPGQEKHLPHEAWHVVQQKQGRVKPTMQLKNVNINDDAAFEHEADVMGEKAVQCKSDDRQIHFSNVNSSCIQRVIPDLGTLEIEGVANSGDTGEVLVNANGKKGTEADVIENKKEALKAIAIMAGNIGELADANLDDEQFYVRISAKYKSRKSNPVTLTLKYDFRKKGVKRNEVGGPGYIVEIEKSRKAQTAQNSSNASATMVRSDPINSTTKYSNIHTTSIHTTSKQGYDDSENILKGTYRKSNSVSDNNIISKNWDAYTKLAGEGARFMCVRENMDKIDNNTVFYVHGESEGVKFSELWQTWSASFNKKYNISNQALSNKLSSTEMVYGNNGFECQKKAKNTLVKNTSSKIIFTEPTQVNNNSIELPKPSTQAPSQSQTPPQQKADHK